MYPLGDYLFCADGHCSRSNQALDLVGLKGEKCHQIIKGTGQNWFKMEFNRSETSFKKISCNSWCTYFASCLNQNTTWKKRCIRKWRCNSKVRRRFSIITTAGNDSLYLRNIKVQYCWMRKFFAIKITLHNIQVHILYSYSTICFYLRIIHSFIHSFMYLFICSFVRSFVYWLINLFVCLFIYLFLICLLICFWRLMWVLSIPSFKTHTHTQKKKNKQKEKKNSEEWTHILFHV